MPASIFRDLYGLVVDGDSFLRAEIIFTTSEIPVGVPLWYIDVRQPTVAGYGPISAGSFADLFPEPQVVSGKVVHLISRQLDLRNQSSEDVQLTGVMLVVWMDASSPVIVAAVRSPLLWRSGYRIGGRLRITSNIYTEP